MSRRLELMQAAAECMERGNNPFLNPFLTDQHVTLDECFDLSDDMARAVRIYLRMDKNERTALSIEAIGDADHALA